MGKLIRTLLLTLLMLPGTALIGSAQAQSIFDSDFDHFKTGWPLEGAHRNADCTSCHVGGIFQGTSRECSDCHSLAGLVRATPLPPDHLPTGNQCQDCHLETSWTPVYRVDHFQLQGECLACHNNGIATGKPPGHVQSSDSCESCHSTYAWTPARFDHFNVMPGSCIDCHNNGIADGKDPGHIQSSNICDDCHTTTAWEPAFFNHASVTPGGCNACHADDKDSGHLVTSQSCDDCHTTTAWQPAFFSHMSAAYPGDHGGSLGCSDCHGANTQTFNWPSPGFQPDCAGCHEAEFRPGPHKSSENPDAFYSVSQLRDCAGACHVYTDATQTTIKEFRSGPEHSVNRGDF